LKFQAVAEKTAKDARGLLYFAAPGTILSVTQPTNGITAVNGRTEVCKRNK